jgi:hypothetical protein
MNRARAESAALLVELKRRKLLVKDEIARLQS